MTNVLSALWWSAAVGGVVAVLVAAVDLRRRRRALLVATVLFGVAGLLGILSVGILFLVAAVVCAIVAMRPGREGGPAGG